VLKTQCSGSIYIYIDHHQRVYCWGSYWNWHNNWGFICLWLYRFTSAHRSPFCLRPGKAPWHCAAQRAHLGSLWAVGYDGHTKAGDVHDVHRHAHQTTQEEHGTSEAWAISKFEDLLGGLYDGFYGLYDFWIFWLMQYRDTHTVFVYMYIYIYILWMTDGGWLDFGCWSPLIVAIGGVDHQQNHRRWGYVISVCNAMYLYMYLYYIRLVEFLDIWYINLHCIILHTSPYMIFTYTTCYIFTHIQILYLDIWYTSIHICSIYLHLAIAIVAS